MLRALRRRYTGRRDALALALFGIAIGLFSGAATVAFRETIEWGESLLVPAEGYAATSGTLRFFSPIVGVLSTIALLYAVGRGPVRTGVVHVLEQLAMGNGRLPLRNAAVQFLAASLLLMFGGSCRISPQWVLRSARTPRDTGDRRGAPVREAAFRHGFRVRGAGARARFDPYDRGRDSDTGDPAARA